LRLSKSRNFFLLASLCALLVVPAGASANALNRDEDPVVLTGSSIPSLLGIPPSRLVAFRYQAGWQQIPVQVDERALLDLNQPYDGMTCSGTNSFCYPKPPNGVLKLLYTDANTFTGADANPNIDADDEVALMAKDAGVKASTFSYPAGTVSGSALELNVADPIGGGHAYVYLFKSDGSLNPGAGQQYVNYQFNLASGNYLSTYKLNGGPNAENSTVTTPNYSQHFSERWADDELHVTAGAASGVDILDRHKNLFAPGNCTRSEDTFDAGEGNFIANKTGPVRAIRSYMGANSGPQVQRQHIFYQDREDITTYLRVHIIPGVMDFFDYSPQAAGMTYRNDFNPAGVTIDGVPESPATGPITWETVDGAQGGLSMVGTVDTNIAGFAYTSYYLDSASPSTTQCTGDASAYGSSGLYVNQFIPSTDEANGGTARMTANRTIYFEAPGQTNGPARKSDFLSPLTFSTGRIAPYDIPADASPISVPLVPAFRQTISSTQCGARGGATSTHGAPLALTSCNPPAYAPGTMARLGPQATGSAQLTVVRGDLSTAADEADVSLGLSATDVRDRLSGGDYTPNSGGPDVTLVYKLRVTDSANGASQTDPGTTTDLDFRVPANCTASAGAQGADCNVSTSADGVMPGVIKEAKDMVLQTFRIRVDDAGQNAAPGDGDDRNFAMQGIYVP
jgi:hypothetical protein